MKIDNNSCSSQTLFWSKWWGENWRQKP